MRRAIGVLCLASAGLLTAAVLLWALAAAWLGPMARAPALVVVLVCLGVTVGFWVRLRPLRRAACAGLAPALGLVLLWRIGLRPSNDRAWQPDVARTAWAEIHGHTVTVHNVRYCDYRSKTDFDVRYEDRRYDLDSLRHADMFLVDWGLGAIAHTMFSFGFADGQYLCFSIETRKEVGEDYSASRGFFRNYELIYVAADERDVVRLRTTFRDGEDVYLYRLRPLDPDVPRAVFLEYLERLNQLRERPEWYNALTDNCMTSAYRNIAKHARRSFWDWRILANGYAAELAYEEGVICTDIPYPELKQACRVNDRARAVRKSEDFSTAIRQGLPGVSSVADPAPGPQEPPL